MYAILGEDVSDTESLKAIVRLIHKDNSIPIKSKGFSGCGEMIRKGKSYFETYRKLGVKYFIIAYDADRADPAARRAEALEEVIKPSKVEKYCIVVPVQELEAWILADLDAIGRAKVCSGWKPCKPIASPERISSPKEHLKKLTRDDKDRSRYKHAVNNPVVAACLDLNIVAKKCPSFRPLRDFVNQIKAGTI
ncbi:MAG TPA: DUF4276 family protein [Planctomycetota bacterium]|nr:DUF4276 family protein [Planctomycetota bacterium]